MKFEPPRRYSASQILAEFYHRCRALGIDLWLSHRVRNKWGRLFTVSAAIVVEDEIVCFVWIRASYNASRNITPKRHRIESLGIPLIILRAMDRVPSAIDEVKTLVAAAHARKNSEMLATVEPDFQS